jgi:putative flippase GtrA
MRWLKFNAVGGIGILVQLASLALLSAGLHLSYLLATVLAVEAAIVHNFFWHARFTWVDRAPAQEASLTRFLKFNLSTGAFSILGNLVFMGVFVGVLRLNPIVANLLAIACCSLANFAVSDLFVFRAAATHPVVARQVGLAYGSICRSKASSRRA